MEKQALIKERNEDRRKEYEFLRAEIRGADLSCQVLAASLVTATGAIVINWMGLWYAGLAIQLIWLFGMMYFAERRFAIARIARYIRNSIEGEGSGFGYESSINTDIKRPISLPTPLCREVSLGVIISLFVPVVIIKASSQPVDVLLWVSIGFAVGISALGVKICLDYKNYRKQ